jgi:hypothetical protein
MNEKNDIGFYRGMYRNGFAFTITTTAQRPNPQDAIGAPRSTDEMKARLEQAVKDGKMTQEQADEMLSQFESGGFQPGDRQPPDGVIPPGTGSGA